MGYCRYDGCTAQAKCRPYLGNNGGYVGIMEEKMEATIWCLGFIGLGTHDE